MNFDTEQFHPCVICREMTRGVNHVCDPQRVGKITFGSYPPTCEPLPDLSRFDCKPLAQLTEADVRRIVREELEASRNGAR